MPHHRQRHGRAKAAPIPRRRLGKKLPVAPLVPAEDSLAHDRVNQRAQVVAGHPCARAAASSPALPPRAWPAWDAPGSGRASRARSRPRSCKSSSSPRGSPPPAWPNPCGAESSAGRKRCCCRRPRPQSGPRCRNRRKSCVPGMACSSPTMAMGMPLFWMNSTMRSKMSSLSVSKPRMKPPITSHPVALDPGHALQQTAPRVLQLVAGNQARLIRSLDAQEDGFEARILHQLHQLRIVGQIQRGFGDEVEAGCRPARATRPAPAAVPLPAPCCR